LFALLTALYPTLKRRGFYGDFYNNTGDGWHECGKCKKAPNDPFNFCLGEGYGEIIEVPNRGRYRAFRTGTTIVLD
jgi:hypothetical protein